MHKTIKTQTERTLFKRTAIAACVMTAFSIHAQAQDSEDPAVLEEVVVYGIKQSLQNAQDIKREASTVKDVITSSDIGALPDKSVVEALQRIPGVAIERFEASSDPDHFAVEGGNVTVRGLNRTRAEINGRDSFSANGAGGLNFSDISPQMVGAVEVVKSQSASITEGAISGNINLITRKPFDSDDLVLGITAKGQYADLADEITPEISALVSNVWETDAGKFGALMSVSFSNVKTDAHGVGVFNYKPVVNASSNPDNDNLFAPLSGSARQQMNDRDRLGFAGSLQWQNPSETVQTTLEFIRSDSTLSWTEHFIEWPTQPFSNDADPSKLNLENATYDCPKGNDITGQPCRFTSGVIIGGGHYDPAKASSSFKENPFYSTGTRVREDERVVNDLSLNIEYSPSENLKLIGDLQYINATSKIYDMQALTRMADANGYLDLRGGEEAKFEVFNKEGTPLTVDNSDSYFMRSAMDFAGDNEAEEIALQLDGEYTFDHGFAKAIKAGVRVSNKTFDYQETEYNWGALGETWMSSDADNISDIIRGDALADAGYIEAFTFEDHMNGKSLTINDTFYVPSAAALLNSEEYYKAAVGSGVAMGGHSWKPLSTRGGVADGTKFLPAEIGSVEEDRSAVYVQFDFGSEDTDVPYSGNIGLRYVNWQLSATGANFFGPLSSDGAVFDGELNDYINSPDYNQYNSLDPLSQADWQKRGYKDYFTETAADPAQAIADYEQQRDALTTEVNSYLNRKSGGVTTVEGDEFSRVLPSFNLKLGLTDDFVVRFAASQSVFLPGLDKVRNTNRITQSIQVDRADNPANPDPAVPGAPTFATGDRIVGATLGGYVANGGGNPLLQPELANNYDVTFEWYNEYGSLTSSFFYKRIHDYFRQSTITQNIANSDGVGRAVAITRTENAGVAKVQGYELALTTSLGFISDSAENFGIQTSYTFIDGSSSDYGNTNYGATPGDKYALEFTYNNINDLPLEGLSQDNVNLMAYYDNGTFQTRFAYSWRSKYLLNSRDDIAFAPVFGEATGQLDWSASLQVTEQIKVGLEATNILDEVTKTSILNEINSDTALYNQETFSSPRSYFVNDRRFAIFVQAQF
ncbi:TonB-dependent receptor [Marinagarivorans algicola]|uniref:TonB-dependent receptor n=1 Tax=Marinagarivorans algicola TaxID=1513270 RepID=UPI0037359D71